jgi:hypothetical protein
MKIKKNPTMGITTKSQQRNLNPTPEAVFAMFHWHKRYSQQGGGAMDFYDALTLTEKQHCFAAVHRIKQSL